MKALYKFEDYKNIFSIPPNGQCNIASLEVQLIMKTNMKNMTNMTNMKNMKNMTNMKNTKNMTNMKNMKNTPMKKDHTEFYAKYSFKCDSIKLINKVEFSYFMTFPNSGELEVQFISDMGSTSFEVEADKPVNNTKGVTIIWMKQLLYH